MKKLPFHATIIQLSKGDMQNAVEYWLNAVMLKAPCAVIAVKEIATEEGGRFEIEFGQMQHERMESGE